MCLNARRRSSANLIPSTGELRWDADTVDAVERDVLAPAARNMFDAFAPEWNTRVQMRGSNLALGWPQMEQMLARVTMRES
ncbi:hypothetical protein NOU13_31875 [Rhodococcus erythropolis]|uniref:hypothetical protein n=1 Tax=Rhodococcus erythropolis TaxID=1833 RepID=UPI00210F1365|nr:hypothetical protein [Rhodococcus erythropolis]MCQ4129105.1 hypothetical protein [Rhodococcus erythropolis]